MQFAHRKCVQRWCNEKGDITCEICHQVLSIASYLLMTASFFFFSLYLRGYFFLLLVKIYVLFIFALLNVWSSIQRDTVQVMPYRGPQKKSTSKKKTEKVSPLNTLCIGNQFQRSSTTNMIKSASDVSLRLKILLFLS
uniref:RING-CH-type domain-containing protein n=1 Tax=Nelumbo nucifera TaxID=4432 RepID=A0A822YFE9_NELNU|nr:TPA_asm: hypothetical protein HUJ06_010111 [Nelumbo nucifera]